MKRKFAIKKVLAFVLCVVMLTSCWVFTAPSASAAGATEYAYRIEHADDSPVYHIEIDIHIIDAGNGFNRVFIGTETGNPDGWGWDDKDYKDMGGIVMWYKDNNGTAANEKSYSIDFSPSNNKTGYYHSDNTTAAKTSLFPQNSSSDWDSWDNKYYTLCMDLSGFPTAYAVYNNNDHMKLTWTGYKPDTWTDFEITQIRVSGYDSSVDLTSEEYDSYLPIFTGNIRSASTDGANCSRYYIQQNGTVSIWQPNSFGTNFEGNTDNNWVHFSDYADGNDAMKKGGSFNSAYSKSWSLPKPQIADYSFTKSADNSEYYVAGEHAVLSSPYAFSNKDQYGAVLAGTLEQSFRVVDEKHYANSAWTASSFATPCYTLNGATGEITPTKANGYEYHQYTIRPETTWIISGNYINVDGAVNGLYYGNERAALMDYPELTVNYQYKATNTLSAPVLTDAQNEIYDSMGAPTATNVADASINAGYKAYYGDTVSAVPAADKYTDHYYDATGHYAATQTPYTAPGTMTQSHTPMCVYSAPVSHNWSDWAPIADNDITENMNPATYHRSVCSENGETHYRYQLHHWDAGVENPKATCTEGGTITYTCADCHDKKKVATTATGHTSAAAVTENYTAANCESIGGYDTVVYCSVCNAVISSVHTTIPATGHNTEGVAWSSDNTNHWQVCKNANCPNPIRNQSGHTPAGEATVTKAATCTETGTEERLCSECNHAVESTIVIDSTNHNHELQKVVPDELSIDDVQSGASSTGYVYFQCTRCNNVWAAEYNDTDKEYDVKDFESNPTGTPESNIDAIVSTSEEIPAPSFNMYYDDGGIYDTEASSAAYDYAFRGASLKRMNTPYEDGNTLQDIRFSGSVSIPHDVSTAASKDAKDHPENYDNVILDFGFVYTQDSYMGRNPANLTLDNVRDDPKYLSMSVVDNNEDNGTYDVATDNWAGVTYHAADDSGYNPVDNLTFNLVISVKAKNWNKLYAGRPYIQYKYHGQIYTVYDIGATQYIEGKTYSRGSVFGIGGVIALCGNTYHESQDMVDYCRTRIAIPKVNSYANYDAYLEKQDWWPVNGSQYELADCYSYEDVYYTIKELNG